MENEICATEWYLNELSIELYWWYKFYSIAFFKDEPIPIPVLTFERSQVNNLGFFRLGLNDWAVRNQVNLNKLYLHNSPRYELLATWLHELTHLWETIYVESEKRTKNWYHPQTFRQKMKEFGIACNDKGYHREVGDPFVFLLRKHGISFNKIYFYGKDQDGFLKIPPKKKPKGKSRLKKWSCGCTNIRAAVEVDATCDKCRNKFEKQT